MSDWHVPPEDQITPAEFEERWAEALERWAEARRAAEAREAERETQRRALAEAAKAAPSPLAPPRLPWADVVAVLKADWPYIDITDESYFDEDWSRLVEDVVQALEACGHRVE